MGKEEIADGVAWGTEDHIKHAKVGFLVTQKISLEFLK